MRKLLSVRRTASLALFGLAGLLAAALPLCAQTILLDNFTPRPNGNVTDFNRDLDIRQTGTAAPSGYSANTNNVYSIQVGGGDASGVQHNSLQLAPFDNYGVCYLSNNHNFTEAGGQSITYTVQVRQNGPANAGDWHAIAFGTSAAKRNTFVNQTDGLGLLLRGNGGYILFDGGSVAASKDVGNPAFTGTVSVRIDLSAAASGPQTVDIYLNGTHLDLGGTGAGSAYTKAAGFTGNYITLMQQYDPGYGGFPVTLIDNFKVAITSPVASPPTAPTLTAAAGVQSVTLNFPGSTNATSYSIYRGTAPGGEGTTPLVTGVTGTTYTDRNLTVGTTYYYVVKAVNSVGTSAASNEAFAVPTDPVLVARYTFEDGPNGNGPGGSPKISDVTGTGSNASFQGGSPNDGFVTDPQQGTYAGSTDAGPFRYIQLPDNFNFGDQFTIFTYTKISGTSDIQTIFANAEGGNSNGFKVFVNGFHSGDGSIHFEGLDSYVVSPTGVYPLGDNVWHSVAVSANRTAGTASVYFDGTLVASGSTSTYYSTSNAQNLLGVFPGGGFITTAKFDDFRIYNGALSAAQIAAIANPATTVTGSIALEGVNNLSAVNPAVSLSTFHVEFRTPGTTTAVKSADVSLSPVGTTAFGTFSVSGVTPGTYDVAFKGGKQLRVVQPSVHGHRQCVFAV